ncbi:Transcriptional regulator PadR-like family protein [Sporomusa ovata DSM 2662]|uniref:Transcriptional regulator, PadR family n=2 Tax=Sporomusa ovata TaxID=2378 RepID=A0A0U1KTP6_9FIRM|nr:putative transcriptional regulator [Sporomusa ovata DSM 2662]CQR70802.1 Transcriptional regulator, PadR family [Sporomusa ovata]
MCVLVLAAKQDTYGYELAHKISENFQIAEGTIYPLLRRMTQEAYFETYLIESSEGPPRKYYRLTATGRMYMQEIIKEWREFCNGVDRIIAEEVGE